MDGAVERIVVGMAGGDGLEVGLELLAVLRSRRLEVHLVVDEVATAALGTRLDDAKTLAAQLHPHANQAARISSGSFLTRGMIVAPCSAGAATAIGLGLSRDLVERAADVTLKERRPLVLAVPEPSVALLDADVRERLSGVPGLRVIPLTGPPAEIAPSLLRAF